MGSIEQRNAITICKILTNSLYDWCIEVYHCSASELGSGCVGFYMRGIGWRRGL